MPSTGPKTKTDEQLMERRKRTAELYLQCESMAEIGRQLGVSPQTVYKDICWAREQWRTRAADAIEVHKQRELSRIDHLELEAWRAWIRSSRPAVSVTHETGTGTIGGGELGAVDKTKRTTTGQAGDPRFLGIVDKCIVHRRAILGLDAPIKQEIGGLEGIAVILAQRVARVEGPV